jgi:2-phospho-L-lactate/phosphoenolpyruvate guanylyltransferase
MATPGIQRAADRPGADAAVVVIPVKAFDRAKVRLSAVLDGAERAALARALADRVVVAARPLGIAVVCDDDVVASWARDAGAAVVWTPGLDLNAAVTEAVERLAAAGVRRAVVAHADLPFAAGLAGFDSDDDDELLVVADRRRDGTNVLSVPTGRGFRFAYGPGSFDRHRAEADRCALRVRVVDAEHLAWDVDEPADLEAPAHLGLLPVVGTSS